MSSVDRRTFLKGLGAATAISVVGSGGELAAATPRGADAPVWKKAPCNLCGVGCGLLVAIRDGRAIAVKGDPDSPVSRGLACVKGYHSIQALYGSDRIERAMVRRNGRLVEAPLEEALDRVARAIRDTIETHGKDSVALYGSGHWSITDAYVASKLFKGALGTNNVDSSARLYGGSGRAGLVGTFGLDGAVGCYEDLDHADVFVLWDHNMAETDPVLFSRILQRRRANPAARIVDLTTRTTRTSYAADRSLVYAPRSDLALANAICHEIIAREWEDRNFLERHVAFKRGRAAIGYEIAAEAAADTVADATWSDYVRFLSAYTPERVQRLSGVPAEDIRWLASLYGDRARSVMSIWGPSLNQHSRGTWLNDLLYGIHLLVGKIAAPGNGPLCLAAQPGAASAHDAGTLTDSLPLGSVTRAADRALAARVWGVPAERIGARPGHTGLGMFRALERGDVRFLWIQATNPMVSLPNPSRHRQAARRPGRFIVVSEAYPTPTTEIADVILPAAMWIEREGVYGNAERRTQHFEQMLRPPGDAMGDAWLMIEVARRLGFGALFPWNHARHVGGIWSEYARFHDGSRASPTTLDELRARPGVMWPVVGGRETKWRYNTAHDPAADAARGAYDFYGHPDHRAWLWLRPHEAPAEAPDRDYPFWLATGRVLEHSGTGTLTRRIPTLRRAMPRAYVEINREDAAALGVGNGERVRLVSRRGSLELEARIDHRSQPPTGQLFVPTFDETHPANRLTIDAGCPLSGQPDSGMSAVRLERLAPGARP